MAMNRHAAIPAAPEARISIDNLFAIVSAAASQDPRVMLDAATQLKNCIEKHPGTVNGLHEIASQTSIPLSIRQLAIIQCKNEIPTQWRHRKFLTPQDKIEIRQRCVGFLNEEDDVVSQCNEIIVGKIARSDYPNAWPTLIDHLTQQIQQGFAERDHLPSVAHETSFRILKRSLGVLKAILKEFSSARMPLPVKVMGQIMLIIHGPLSARYGKASVDLRSRLNQSSLNEPRTVEDIHLCRLLLKCVTLMATWVWQSSTTARREVSQQFEDWVIQVLQASTSDLQNIYGVRRAIVASSGTASTQGGHVLIGLTRYIRTIGKFFRRLQQLRGSQFASMPSTEELVFFYWDQVVQSSQGPNLAEDSPTAMYPVRFLVQAMVLFRDALAQWSPKKATTQTSVIDQNFIQTAITFLVTQFIPLKESDLESWMSDPEDFVNVEDNEDVQWEFSLRPCAERVLMTFSSQYPEVTNPLLISAFNNVNANLPTTLSAILEKEAVYGAIGRCSHRLKDAMNLSGWLDVAVLEARSTDSKYLILKRRIAWLLGRWMIEGTMLPRETRVWEILVHLLSDDSLPGSEVVRLTAGTAIQHSVDAVNVTARDFSPYLPAILGQLVDLMKKAESLESKRKVNDNLNAVIARAEESIGPFMNSVAEPLPQLWTESGKDFLFKTSIMNTLGTLITSLREQSVSLSALVVPIVAESLSPEFSVQLDEAALRLWQIALRHTVTLQGAPGLGSLVPSLIQLFETNWDLLGRLTHILESYFLLGANDILQAYAVPLFSSYLPSFNGALQLNFRDMLRSLELLFQLANPAIYAGALHASGLFAWLTKSLVDDKFDVLDLTIIVYIHARIVIASPDTYLKLMAATAQSTGISEQELWSGVLGQWWRRFDNISEPRYRKLCALGAAALVSTGRPEVLDQLAFEILNIWADVLAELKEEQKRREDDEEAVVSLFWDQPSDSFYKGSENTSEYTRRKAVFDNDIVRQTLMSAYIAQRLQEAEAVCGSHVMQSILYKADQDLWKSVEKDIFGRT